MTEESYLLLYLAEECAEVQHRISKALRFGLDEIREGHDFDNRELIGQELDDLFAVVKRLREDGILRENSRAGLANKGRKIDRFMDYSRDLGILV